MLSSDIPVLDLNTPYVPAATGNGGLRYLDLSDPQAPIIVEAVLDPNSAKKNDSYKLYWQGDYVSSELLNDEHLQRGLINLVILAGVIRQYDDGLHEFRYTVTSPISGETTPSPPAEVRVKSLVPGGTDPDAGTEFINEDLLAPGDIPDVIEDNVQNVRVVIPAYENMAEGDKIVLDWGGERLSHAPLQQGEVGNSVPMIVNRNILESRPGRVIVRYEIRDVVNNWSKWSLAKNTDVEVGDAFMLAPWVLEADNNDVLDLAVLAGGNATAQALDRQMSVGDQVNLIWSGYPPEGLGLPDFTVSATVASTGRPLNFSIPNDQIKLIAQGYASLRYEISKAGLPNPLSRRARVDVIGQAELPLATIISIKDSLNEIPPAGSTTDTSVTLTGRAAPGEQVQIFDTSADWGIHPVNTQGVWSYTRVGLTAKTYRMTVKGLYGDNSESAERSFIVQSSQVSGDESFEGRSPGPLPLNQPIDFSNGLKITITAAGPGTAIVVAPINEFGNLALFCAPGNKIRFEFGGEIKTLLLSHLYALSATNLLQLFNRAGTVIFSTALQLPEFGQVGYVSTPTLSEPAVSCELTVDANGLTIDNLVWMQ